MNYKNFKGVVKACMDNKMIAPATDSDENLVKMMTFPFQCFWGGGGGGGVQKHLWAHNPESS